MSFSYVVGTPGSSVADYLIGFLLKFIEPQMKSQSTMIVLNQFFWDERLVLLRPYRYIAKVYRVINVAFLWFCKAMLLKRHIYCTSGP